MPRLVGNTEGSAWDGTLRKLRFQLRESKQSFGGVCSQAEPENELAFSTSNETPHWPLSAESTSAD